MARYSDEVAGLPTAYSLASNLYGTPIFDRAKELLAGRDLYAVGSGGTLAVATLAAGLHEEKTGRSAHTVTPLQFVEQSHRISNVSLLIFSARAKHPDTAFAAARALALGIPIVLVTQKMASELAGPLAHASVVVVTVPKDSDDGFLATQSVLSMAMAASALYGVGDMPADLLLLPINRSIPLKRRFLVLHGSAGEPAAVDIETRMNELGLADVQVSDWRNIAHGRHVGLNMHIATTTVIALVSPEVRELADRTLSLFPSVADILRFETEIDGAAGSVELLASSMQLPMLVDVGRSFEPSRPEVPSWGRKLYHLPFKRMFRRDAIPPQVRKTIAAGFRPGDVDAVALHADAYVDWFARLRLAPIDVLVLDYDGTCVATPDRFSPPTMEVQKAILRILEMNVPIVFATGRGGSLYEGLRSWVPEDYWKKIHLGLHNGAWEQPLGDQLSESDPHFGVWQAELVQRLERYARSGLLSVRHSKSQVSISGGRTPMNVEDIASLVAASTFGKDEQLRIASSAHSVDVIDSRWGKDKILSSAEARWGTALAIGDRGCVGGNDFALLASTPYSISVDAVSPDLTRCWPTMSSATRGPAALVSALNSLSLRRGLVRYVAPRRDA